MNTTTQPLAVSVERVINAPAEVVYDLISDVTRMGEFSPECRSCEWVGDTRHAAVGARFKGTNTLGKLKWSTKPTVTAADRGRSFAFKVPGGAGPVWTYELRPVDGGTRVTESMRQEKRSPLPIRLLQRRAGVTDRAAHLRDGMNITLRRLGAAAESAN